MAFGQAQFTDHSGNPEDARYRIAPMDLTTVSGGAVWPNVPPQDSTYQQGHTNGQGLMVTRTEIPDAVLSTSGQPQDSLAGKQMLEGGPLDIGTVDPANPIMICALGGVFKAYEQDDNTTDQQWRFFVDAAAGSGGGGDAVEAFMFQENNQVWTPVRATNMKFTGFEWVAEQNGPFTIQFPFIGPRYDLFGAISQTAGSGSTLPRIIGTFDGNLDPEATDKDIYVRFDTASSPYTISVKVGAAAAYSNTQTLTEGEWLRLQDEGGNLIGTHADQPQLFIASGATITLNDEFKIERRSTGWTDSLGTRRPISSVNIRAYVDTDAFGSGNLIEIPVTELSGNANWDGVDDQMHVPSAQGRDITVGGSLVGEINLSRKIRDLLFQNRIHNGDEVAFILDAKSDTEIGSTGKYFRFVDVRPRCLVTGSTYQVPQGGGGVANESPTLIAKEPPSAYTYDGESYSKHISILLQNEVSDITELTAA